MNKKIAILLGAIAGVATFGAAQAATPVDAGNAIPSSYADRFEAMPPTANDTARAPKSTGEIQVAQVQVRIGDSHRHHRYHRKPVIVVKRHHRHHDYHRHHH